MIHPFMPHITEELWHVLQLKPDNALLSLQKWPIHENKFVDNKPVSYTHLRAHETRSNLVCRLLLEKKKS